MLGTKDPQWFLVGERKLPVMMLVTLGLYQLYWFYKQWERVRDAGDNVAPAPRAIFTLIFCHSLFRRIIDSTHAVGVKTSLPAWLLTVGFIVPSLDDAIARSGVPARLPGPHPPGGGPAHRDGGGHRAGLDGGPQHPPDRRQLELGSGS